MANQLLLRKGAYLTMTLPFQGTISAFVFLFFVPILEKCHSDSVDTLLRGNQVVATVSKRGHHCQDPFVLEVKPKEDVALLLAFVATIDTITHSKGLSFLNCFQMRKFICLMGAWYSLKDIVHLKSFGELLFHTVKSTLIFANILFYFIYHSFVNG